MTAITDIIGREILDSRGNPTVEVDVVLEAKMKERALQKYIKDFNPPISAGPVCQLAV